MVIIIFIKNIKNSVTQYTNKKVKKVLYKYLDNNIIKNWYYNFSQFEKDEFGGFITL